MSNEWIVGAIIVMAFKPEIMAQVYRGKKVAVRYTLLARKKIGVAITHRRRQLSDWNQKRTK